MLKIFNTLTRKVETFKPIKDRKVGMYSCGITAYYSAHIGNMRQYVVQDLLKRLLIHHGYSIKHVQNVTDVGHLVSDADSGEDKLRLEAEKERKSMKDVADFYLGMFLKDMKELNILKPDIMPKASGHIREMLSLIKTLEEKGYIYRADDGMYFDTSMSNDYGALTGMSREKLEESLMEGARIGKREGKRNITDFCVWRFAHGDEKEMIWNSPWGRGFPGWHIECSAMSMKYLGEHFDIHCGGIDHIQIHHTNEIAQSEAATGKKFVNYWFETNFLTVNGMKMSKSLRNLYTVSDIVSKGYSPMALRLFLLSGRHTQSLNFTFDAMKDSQNRLDSIYSFMDRMASVSADNATKGKGKEEIKKFKKSFFAAMDDDLNTPEALSSMHLLINTANKIHASGRLGKSAASEIIMSMLDFDSVLGIGISEHATAKKGALPEAARLMIEEREAARKAGDFGKADRIREELRAKYGIVVEDTRSGPAWRPA